nr:MAG TPA: hypothetical protein [Caudoviricetes sp.]
MLSFIIAPYCAQIRSPIHLYYSRGDRASGRDYVRNKLCLRSYHPPNFQENA